MHVFHTAGVPPISGSSILPTIGWTRNSKNALTKRAPANNHGTRESPEGDHGIPGNHGKKTADWNWILLISFRVFRVFRG
jgi:hypothetical protein